MTAKDVLRGLLRTNDYVIKAYLADLSDEEILQRPGPGANPIAWQMGHLIQSEQSLLNYLTAVSGIELPAGWADQHSAAAAAKDPAGGYRSKAEYLDAYKKSRDNILKILDAYPDSLLDTATEGRMKDFAPTHGAVLSLIANHPMMHAGQIATLRRRLGKPVVI